MCHVSCDLREPYSVTETRADAGRGTEVGVSYVSVSICLGCQSDLTRSLGGDQLTPPAVKSGQWRCRCAKRRDWGRMSGHIPNYCSTPFIRDNST